MIETSTPITNPSNDTMKTGNIQDDALGEEDQQFLLSLQNDLNRIARQPAREGIENLLNYSRLLRG